MKAATKPATPLLSQPRVQRVLYPVLIGVVLARSRLSCNCFA